MYLTDASSRVDTRPELAISLLDERDLEARALARLLEDAARVHIWVDWLLHVREHAGEGRLADLEVVHV